MRHSPRSRMAAANDGDETHFPSSIFDFRFWIADFGLAIFDCRLSHGQSILAMDGWIAVVGRTRASAQGLDGGYRHGYNRVRLLEHVGATRCRHEARLDEQFEPVDAL